MKKGISIILLVIMLLTITFSSVYAAQNIPQNDYRKLQDIKIFVDSKSTPISGWAAGGVEVKDGKFAVDEVVTNNGLPSIKIHAAEPTGWWGGALTVAGWTTNDFSSYYENGKIEFDVIGTKGEESFTFGITDDSSERYVNGVRKQNVEVSRVIKINSVMGDSSENSQWQHVEIPLKELCTPESGFRLTQVQTVTIGPDWGNMANGMLTAQTFWINNLRITSPDNERSYPEIKVNQVGYFAEAEKYAIVSGFAEELMATKGTAFNVVNAANKNVVFSGKLQMVKEYDAVISGEKVLKADFTRFKERGTYYLTVDGIEESSPEFKIGNDIYNNLLADATRYLYYQRCGMELKEEYAGKYSHPVWFAGEFADKYEDENDEACPLESGYGNIKLNVNKGWFDAGDFGKYMNAAAQAVQPLLFSYEMFPELFADYQLNIPESGNGIPDILDEVKYELDFMLSMQDESTGGFYSTVFMQNTNPWAVSDSDSDRKTRQEYKRVIIDKDDGGNVNVKPTSDTASAVNALAHASIVFKDIDAAYSAKILNAAENGWSYLESNPNTIAIRSGIPYRDTDDRQERLAAAGSLFRATEEEKYNKYVKNNYTVFENDPLQDDDSEPDVDQTNKLFGKPSFAVSNGISFINYVMAKNPDKKVVKYVESKFKPFVKTMENRALRGTWRNTISENFYWGCNGTPGLGATYVLTLFSNAFGIYNDDIANSTLSNMNYMLGINPVRYSFISGYGQYSLQYPYSGIYNFDQKSGVPKGILAGGTNEYQGRNTSRFDGKCYVDTNSDWTINEHTIYWNASLVFNLSHAISAERNR